MGRGSEWSDHHFPSRCHTRGTAIHLAHIEVDIDTRHPSLFHMSVDDISFLGRAILAAGAHSSQGMSYLQLSFFSTES